MRILVDYARLEPVKRCIADHGAEVLDESFGTSVVLMVSVDQERRDALTTVIRDLTAGSAVIERQNP